MSSDRSKQDIHFIRTLTQLMQGSDIGEIEVSREYGEGDELRIRITRQSAASAPAMSISTQPVVAPAPIAPAPAPAAAPPAKPQEDEDPAANPNCLTSPMVGTVYLAPSPESDAFVNEGDEVREGQTVLIIEAMKTMNQIPAPRAGRVSRILAADKAPVEYGAPLMIIE